MARRAVHHGVPQATGTLKLTSARSTNLALAVASKDSPYLPPSFRLHLAHALTLRWAVTEDFTSCPCSIAAWRGRGVGWKRPCRRWGLRTGTSRGDSGKGDAWGELFSSSIRNGPSWFICCVHEDGDGSEARPTLRLPDQTWKKMLRSFVLGVCRAAGATAERACPLPSRPSRIWALAASKCIQFYPASDGVRHAITQRTSVVMAAFVADAAAMPLHWIYDTNQIAEWSGIRIQNFTTPSCPFYKYQPTWSSPYGQQTVSHSHGWGPEWQLSSRGTGSRLLLSLGPWIYLLEGIGSLQDYL